MPTNYALRQGTASGWAAANPVLRRGESVIETHEDEADDRWKLGDGTTLWVDLPYQAQPAPARVMDTITFTQFAIQVRWLQERDA